MTENIITPFSKIVGLYKSHMQNTISFNSFVKLFPSSLVLLGIITITLQSTLAQNIIIPPYIQPGNAPSLNKEEKVVIWQTDSIPAKYRVEWAQGITLDNAQNIQIAKTSTVKLRLNNQTTYLHRAVLTNLEFDQNYVYRVIQNGIGMVENTFVSRSKKQQSRFAVFGDMGTGSQEQAAIAYQIYHQKPQFALLTGDMAYSYGREIEYRVRFFPYYLRSIPIKERGAPLMNSIPFYMLLGNHDIYSADFDQYPDGLAYFYYSDFPRNAPVTKTYVKPEGNRKLVGDFKKNTKNRYPFISNYSFDYGNVHIACLDANYYINPLDPALIDWLKKDMLQSKADWKIVAYHHPAFISNEKHYEYQIMRLLSPVLEELGVDLVLTGHVHNYQRTVPLKFAPEKNSDDGNFIVSESGKVDGKFILDMEFDGINNTIADGIIYVVSGAGGATLYETEISEKPERWIQGLPGNYVHYTAKLVSDRHSFTMIETDGKKLKLQQFDAEGKVFDEILMTK
jgi:acid phosphatase type 7